VAERDQDLKDAQQIHGLHEATVETDIQTYLEQSFPIPRVAKREQDLKDAQQIHGLDEATVETDIQTYLKQSFPIPREDRSSELTFPVGQSRQALEILSKSIVFVPVVGENLGSALKRASRICEVIEVR
jgi:hypothetical protein